MNGRGQLGLDELMIVNPAQSSGEALFLGEDGALYEAQSFDAYIPEPGGEGAGEGLGDGLGHYFLGADGTLYEVVSK